MPDLVVMVRDKETAAIPEASVEGYEFYGWKRAPKTQQADAELLLAQATPTPTAQTQEG